MREGFPSAIAAKQSIRHVTRSLFKAPHLAAEGYHPELLEFPVRKSDIYIDTLPCTLPFGRYTGLILAWERLNQHLKKTATEGVMMGSFSIWHWLIVLILIGLPLVFVLRAAPAGANRFGEMPPSMNFGEAVSSFFRNYVNFSGRASRSEFWYSYLFIFIVGIVLVIVDAIVKNEIISSIWNLAILLPTLAMTARRLHDINRSGWHQLLAGLFPIGPIALIIWYCKRSDDTVTLT